MEFEFLEPVDVLQLWPKDQRALLKAQKWTDRRDALQSLLDLIEKNPRLREDADYGELVKQLKWIIQQDSNVNVAALGARVLTGFARGLPGSAFERFAVEVAPAIFEKFKEKKAQLKEPLIECADALAKTCAIEKLIPAMQEALKKPNPQVKILLDFFIFRTLNDYDTPPMGFLKAVLPIVAKHAEDGDPEVRDSACAAIGAAHRLIGAQGIGQFASAVLSDKNKAAKVSEYLEAAKADAEERRKTRAEMRPVNGSEGAAELNDATAADGTEQQQEAAAIDPWELLEPVDVASKLPDTFQEKLQSKSWQERKDALENLLDLLDKNPRLVADASLYKETVAAVAKVLEKDVNINVCAVAAKCEKGFALGLRQHFSPLATTVIPVCIEKFKEKKPILREPLVECIDAIALTTPLSSYVDTVAAGLSKQNPAVKQQTAMFVARLLRKHNSATVPVEAVRELAPKLDKVASDPDPDVRDAAFAAIGSITRCIGEPAATRLFAETMADTIKSAKVAEEWKKAIAECGQNAAHEAVKLAAARGAGNSRVTATASTPAQAPPQRPVVRPTPRVSSAARPKSTPATKPPAPKVTVNIVRKEPAQNGKPPGKATPSVPAQRPTVGTPVARPRRSLLTPNKDAPSSAAPATVQRDSITSAASNGSTSKATTGSALRPPQPPSTTRRDYSVPRSYSSAQMKPLQPRAPSVGRPSSQASIGRPPSVRRTLASMERPASALDLVCADVDSIFNETSHKQQRYEAEQGGKIFRWKFSIPTPSHESQLRQLFAANTPPDFVELICSENFRCHNRSIDVFAHVLEVNPENVLSNIDLVLKWLSLRLLENNTQTLGKAFNLISAMLTTLKETGRRLAENEADFFVPFVVQKLSDTKLIVSTGTTKVLDALPAHLPLTSVILQLSEGLKTKNRRQQNVCLALMQKMLRDNPTMVRDQSGQPLFLTRLVQPITAVLSDCDPPTRQEALDTLLAVWKQIGNKIDYYVRTLSPDDTAALDELRRQKGSRVPTPTSHIPTLASTNLLDMTITPDGDAD